ncbi:hypothetical protein PC9H_002832 [Pleurotus ostreatus]|uniref:Uncharacterized protein n=1 Tax=Pleurotus ostreatus TaxID=5322 RepID=A0A8H7A1D5_PLEOS|nr:uncharacterized protein PC9H_002832 [Pleurotus ostreatus]KAF7436006.1 hypothetical protein PC9H_002832 [Pleurotus ostreatus]
MTTATTAIPTTIPGMYTVRSAKRLFPSPSPTSSRVSMDNGRCMEEAIHAVPDDFEVERRLIPGLEDRRLAGSFFVVGGTIKSLQIFKYSTFNLQPPTSNLQTCLRTPGHLTAFTSPVPVHAPKRHVVYVYVYVGNRDRAAWEWFLLGYGIWHILTGQQAYANPPPPPK